MTASRKSGRATRAGTRRRFDDDARRTVLDLLEAGGTIATAAATVGFRRQTIVEAGRRDVEFGQELDAAVAVGASQRDASTKFTAEVRTRFFELLREGKRRGVASRMLGLDPGTVRAYAQHHAEFRQERRVAESEADEIIESALFDTARDGNVRAIEVWLFNRKPNVWRDKRQVGIVGATPDAPVAVDVTVQDKTESSVRIGRALERTGALGASLAAVLSSVILEDGAE